MKSLEISLVSCHLLVPWGFWRAAQRVSSGGHMWCCGMQACQREGQCMVARGCKSLHGGDWHWGWALAQWGGFDRHMPEN